MAFRNASSIGEADATGPLVPGGHHPAVILIGGQDLVAGLEVDPGDQGLHPLGGVPGDRHLLRIAAELAGQVAADRLDAGLQDVPHVMGRRGVGEPEVAGLRLHHDGRRGADAAVVEVDEAPVGVEGATDLGPVILVAGDLARRPRAGDRAGPRQPRQCIGAEQSRDAQAGHKPSTTRHRSPPRIALPGMVRAIGGPDHRRSGALRPAPVFLPPGLRLP